VTVFSQNSVIQHSFGQRSKTRKSKMAKSTKVKVEKEMKPIVKSEDLIIKGDVVILDDKTEPNNLIFDNIDASIKLIEPLKGVEEKTEEQKIVDYVANSNSEKVDLTPVIKSLYPMATFSEPAKYLQQLESKRLKALIGKMKSEGNLVLENDSYMNLGSPYWIGSDPKTRYHSIESIKIVAVK